MYDEMGRDSDDMGDDMEDEMRDEMGGKIWRTKSEIIL